jgi:hypothetical protein
MHSGMNYVLRVEIIPLFGLLRFLTLSRPSRIKGEESEKQTHANYCAFQERDTPAMMRLHECYPPEQEFQCPSIAATISDCAYEASDHSQAAHLRSLLPNRKPPNRPDKNAPAAKTVSNILTYPYLKSDAIPIAQNGKRYKIAVKLAA